MYGMNILQPSDELRQFVRYYWMLESNEPFSTLTFPIGCPQIIFHRKSPLYIPELAKSQSQFTISGQVNFPAHIQSDGRLDMIVAVFYPHTIGMFIDTPPSSFYNIEISGYDIENRQLNEIARIIFDSEDHNECIAVLEKYLMSKIKPGLNISRIGKSIKALFQVPSLTVSSLSDIACLSKRQFERIFSDTVGMNPKEYARVVRSQKALWLMQNGEHNYAGIASACGFSDQSHFIRDFKAMTGHTPHTLCQYTLPYSDLFTNPA